MNGLLNLLYPLLDALDWSLGFLPAVLRVVLLGVLSGAVAMGLYVLLSNQDSIRARKEEMQRIPGTFGDAVRAVENLPGVGRAPFNIAQTPILRGGKPTDTRAFFAATEVPLLFHFGAFNTVVPTHLVEKLDLYPGNFSVRYGRAIAGALDIELREGKRDRLHGFIDTSVFDTGLGVEGPVGKGSFVVSARRSYIDAVLGAVASVGLLGGSPVSFLSAPVYWDYQALLDYPVLGGKLRLMALGADDVQRLLFAQPAGDDPSVRGSLATHIAFHRLQIRFTRTIGDWSFLAQTSTGWNGNAVSLGAALDVDLSAFISDWRFEARYKSTDSFQLLLGADLQGSIAFLDALAPIPPEEGKLALPLSVTPKEHRKARLDVFNAALYAEATIKWSNWILVPGLRFDYWSGLAHPAFNPRLQAKWTPAARTTIKAGLGLYSQDPQPFDYDPTFGNPRLRPESAIHASAGIEQGLLPGLSVEVTGFYKHLYNLVVGSNKTLLNPDGTLIPERKSNEGDGRIYGGELLVRQALSKYLFGWISYTIMRSERRDSPDSPYRLFDFDMTHMLTLAASVNLPWNMNIGLRFRYLTGFPYTLPRGAQLDADAGVYVPIQGPPNNARLEPIHQLDLRVEKLFIFERWQLKAYLDVTNVYNHWNQENAQYSYDYTRQGATTGLPIVPSFGVRGEF